MEQLNAWQRMNKRKKELGFTVMVFRKNYLFENFAHGVQLSFPRESKIMTDEQADDIIRLLEEVIEENPEVVNRGKKYSYGF